jgi:hypothetical protein
MPSQNWQFPDDTILCSICKSSVTNVGKKWTLQNVISPISSFSTKIDADYYCFTVNGYHSEKKRENSNRGQKMSAKVCQRFLYSLPTLAPIIRHCSVISVSLSVFDSPNQCYPGNPSTHLDCSCI